MRELPPRSHDSSNHKNSSTDKKLVFVAVADGICFKAGRDARIQESLYIIQAECRQNLSWNNSQKFHPSIYGKLLGFHCRELDKSSKFAKMLTNLVAHSDKNHGRQTSLACGDRGINFSRPYHKLTFGAKLGELIMSTYTHELAPQRL